MKRSRLFTPARSEEKSASEKKRAAQLKQRKKEDLGYPETPTPNPRKTLLYANIHTPEDNEFIDDGMGPDSDEDEDQPFKKRDAKMVVSEISAAIDVALAPLTKRILKLETRMDKIESNISDIISDEAFNVVSDYIGQFDLKIDKMEETLKKFQGSFGFIRGSFGLGFIRAEGFGFIRPRVPHHGPRGLKSFVSERDIVTTA